MNPAFQLDCESQLYRVNQAVSRQDILDMAQCLIREDPPYPDALESTGATKSYCADRLQYYEHEVFALLLLNNRHQYIDFVELFRGTINGASVYPREVVKEVLKQNAAAVIFAHNHPSGTANSSQADHAITKRLQDALKLIDVRVLDHIVVGHNTQTSFAEMGYL